MLRYQILTALFVIALPGCSTLPEAEPDTPLAVPAAKKSTVAEQPPETPIPEDNLLPLLQAEFALRARDYNQAVALLTEQAALLTDPALARRALRLAEFVTDAERAAAMAVRLVQLDPEDGAAQAAASGWLSRTGRPVRALEFAGNAYELGHPVNVATTLGNYEQMDDDSKAAIAEALHNLATRW
ncbi:MAG: hypothetical protein ISQ00_05510, partial [Luminiphilus sp.]|nr:hypothetical protein [Luminiphilus sp.]